MAGDLQLPSHLEYGNSLTQQVMEKREEGEDGGKVEEAGEEGEREVGVKVG